MKRFMDWMKANVSIVVLSVLMLLVLPAALVGSSYWNNRIKKKREAEANSAMSKLTALGVSYTIPSPSGGTPITKNMQIANPARPTTSSRTATRSRPR
jgi:hypothetical protein